MSTLFILLLFQGKVLVFSVPCLVVFHGVFFELLVFLSQIFFLVFGFWFSRKATFRSFVRNCRKSSLSVGPSKFISIAISMKVFVGQLYFRVIRLLWVSLRSHIRDVNLQIFKWLNS
jgi:hypothetical protein